MREVCARSGCIQDWVVHIEGINWCLEHAPAPPTPPDANEIITQCVWCGVSLSRKYVTREHVIPRSKGGKHSMNLAPACRRCNGLKGNKDALEFIEVLKARGLR